MDLIILCSGYVADNVRKFILPSDTFYNLIKKIYKKIKENIT